MIYFLEKYFFKILLSLLLISLFSYFINKEDSQDSYINTNLGDNSQKEEVVPIVNSDIEKQDSLNLYKVLRIIDGDTVALKEKISNTEITVRLIGVDAPETTTLRKGYTECFGTESSNYLDNLLNGKEIYLEFDLTQGYTDIYGRTLAYIFLGTENINEALIKNGYAYEYTYNNPYKYQKDFKNSEKYAKENNKGIRDINSCSKVNNKNISIEIPMESGKCIIKGNISKSGEKIYHLPGCKNYDDTIINSSNGEKWFCNEREAKTAGWRKAKNC